MSKWVVMETVDGCSRPVAIRDNHDAAISAAGRYAEAFALKPSRVQHSDMGAVLVQVDASFLAIEVEDVE